MTTKQLSEVKRLISTSEVARLKSGIRLLSHLVVKLIAFIGELQVVNSKDDEARSALLSEVLSEIEKETIRWNAHNN